MHRVACPTTGWDRALPPTASWGGSNESGGAEPGRGLWSLGGPHQVMAETLAVGEGGRTGSRPRLRTFGKIRGSGKAGWGTRQLALPCLAAADLDKRLQVPRGLGR